MSDDITPDDSVAPVFHDSAPIVAPDTPQFVDDSDVVAAAIAKLVGLGLTEEQARAIAGLPPTT